MGHATETPSTETRRLIAQAWTQGRAAHHAVSRFVAVAGRARAGLDSDARSSGVTTDGGYDALVASSGLGRVLEVAVRIEEAVGRLDSGRAA